MATRQFADLSSYRRGVDSAKATGNALDSLLQGFQSGVQLQQLPQRMQAEELALQLQNAINARKLQDLQNPEAALARKLEQELTLKGALNPNLGIVRAPTGLEGQTIATPGALTQEQQSILDAGTRPDGSLKGIGFLGSQSMTDGSGRSMTELSIGVPINGRETEIPTLVPTLSQEEINYLRAGNAPTPQIVQKAAAHAQDRINRGLSPFNDTPQIPSVSPGAPETPISVFGRQLGLNINPNIPEQAAEDKLQRDIRLANARLRTTNPALKGQFIPDGFGGMIFAQAPTTIGGEVTTTRVTTPEGEAVKVEPKGAKATQPKGLTMNAQNALLTKASSNGVDPDDPKFQTEDGQYDFTKLAIATGKAARENKRTENAKKAEGLTGKTRSDIEALNAADKQLDTLKDEIAEIARSGKTPSFLDDFIAVETAAPATGGFGQLWQRSLRGLQSDESKVLEGRKSVISSALTKAISGLAVTTQEATRLGFLPRAGDSFQDLIMKAGLIEDYINNQRAGLSGETTPAAPATTNAASSGSIQIKSIRRKQ